MKYIIRSLKYYCYLILLLTLIILALVLTGFVEADLSKMFVNGYDSLWQIYRLEEEKDGTWSFLRRAGMSRALKMWEDRITITASAAGLEAEGLTRDLPRVVSALEATRPDA